MYLVKVKKIKITFLVFFLLLICGFSFSIVAQENSSDGSVFSDADQDGLSDEKEVFYKTDPKNPDSDNDGYSDGAEVNSGYDPTKPAPGDKLETSETTSSTTTTATSAVDPENLTEEISNRIATMVSSGESSDGFDMNSINTLIEESMANNTTFADLPKIDESTIKIMSQNYSSFSEEKQARERKEDNEEYLSAVFFIISNNLPHSVDSEEAIKSFTNEIVTKIPSVMSSADSGLSYFTNLADNGAIMLEKLNELEVPSDMLDIHKKGLQLATYAVSLKDTVKIDNNDPIASMVSLSAVENIMVLSNDFLTETEAKLEKLNLTDFVLEQNL
ncbi:MAG: thrombospondin type 3 repeat-containing protein [Candidatus Moranbacteria bacterium]|jgi:hypothetical protein|nr:thrombospondin type 3 repeat-containing protein [Candidatus Moranbacteria bacterium]